MTTSEAGIVERGPCVVDEEPSNPRSDVASFVDAPRTDRDHQNADGDEYGVAHRLKVETVLGGSERCVGGFKREQTSPRNVVGGVNSADHVQDCEDQSPDTDEHQTGRVCGNTLGRRLAGVIVAHGAGESRTAFKHTEPQSGGVIRPSQRGLMVVGGVEDRSHVFFCRAHDFTNVHVAWDAGVDFL